MTDLTLALILKAETAAARVALQEMTTAIKGLTPASQAAATEAARIGPAVATAGGQATAVVTRLKTEMAAAGAATRAAAGQVSGSMHLAAGSVANLMAQFNDIGIMLAAGQNPLQLAMQQGTQISQVIGPLGAAGAAKALKAAFMGMITPISLITLGVIAGGAALVQWGMRAFSAGKDTATLTDRVKTLGDATRAYQSAARAAGVTIEELTAKYGHQAAMVRDLLQAQMEQAAAAARIAAEAAAKDTGFGVGVPVAAFRDFEDVQVRTAAALRQMGLDAQKNFSQMGELADPVTLRMEFLTRQVQRLADKYGITTAQARQLAEATAVLEEAKGPQAQAAAAADLAEKMRTVFGAAVQTEGPMKTLYDNLLAQAKAAADLAATSAGLPAKFTAAAGAAGKLADPIDRAVAKAHELGAQLDELTRSEIELQFRGDPLGAARATALAEFDAAIGPAHPVDHAVRDEIAAERQAYADRAVAVARNRAEVDRLNAAEKEGGAALLKTALEGAFAAATGISNTDMAGAIREASREAGGLFSRLKSAAAQAWDVAGAMGRAAAANEQLRSMALEFSPGGQALMQYGSRAPGGTVEQNALGRRNTPVASSLGDGGGGAAAGDTLAALQAEAQALMAALDQQIAAINEKVALGLKTTAEGVDAVAGAKRTAAEALAELIPRIEAVAPTAKGALDQIRALVKGLVPDLVAAGATLGQQMADGFKAPFAAFIAGTKSGKAAFGDFMDFINQKIASMLAERFTNAFITPLFDSIFGAFGIAKVGAVGTAKGLPLKPMAAPSLAKGGVPWRPAILDGPGMALAPPRRPSGATDVPPYAANQSAGKWVIKLEIINKAEGVKASRGPDRMEGGSPVMQIIFEQIEGALAANIGRGVGPLNAALGGSFGLQRQGR